MARALRDARLDTREARLRLKVQAKPYWRLIEPGLHLGYRRLAGRPGSWSVRRYVGHQAYTVETLQAVADDYSEANGADVLSFRQAQRRALEHKPRAATGALTVKGALDRYLEALADRGQQTQDAKYCVDALIVPKLGADVAVEALTTEQIRAWHAALAKSPGRHARKGDDGEAPRRRQSTANRILTILRAALNLAFREGDVPSDAAWKRVRPFDAARVRYLTGAEAQTARQHMRSRLPAFGTSRVCHRLPIRRAGAASRPRLQRRCWDGDDTAIQERQIAARRADGRRRRAIPPLVCWHARQCVSVHAWRQAVAQVEPGAADAGSMCACRDQPADRLSSN
jgi:hypothetical protein